ncbi:lysophospholipid acyltransferase family protein [Paracandidimonas lactea]|uniref:lysophospholipid acyltransferase family protein n=1 Tax=Paracandidimonas lactea TaxID=2895524 RepID=UPI001EF11562|nr:lysophospholipid acyltransferase family protein [Paracandidimonas lactea]
MALLLFPPRFLLVSVWIALGLVSVIAIFPFIGPRARACMNWRWSRVLMALCGVRTHIKGEPRLDGPVMWVANHVSWVDIFVLNCVRPTAFVAKSEIRAWPIIGWLVAGAGTVFIERGRRHAVRAVSEQMEARFRHGEAVGLFPEGTTSPGDDVRPFHSSLFEAALHLGVDIQPVALRFFHRGKRSDYFAFVGEQNLVQNLWYLLGTTGACVELVFLPVLPGEQCREDGRARVAAHAHRVVRHAVIAQA